MKYLHKIIGNLCIIIVINWLFCALFFTHSEFYKDNFDVLDKIDTVIVYISLLHFLFFNKLYSIQKKIFIFTIISVICLNFSYEKMNDEVYYFIYYLLISMPFISCLWKMKKS